MREFEKNIRRVEPYVPGEQPQKKVIKLNTYGSLPEQGRVHRIDT